MKKNIIMLITTLVCCFAFYGCDDMFSVYQEYKGESPIHYPAKVKNVSIRTGFNKAELSWPAVNDPTIKKVEITWGNGIGSASYDWDSSLPFFQEIDNLPEGSIIFTIRTMDNFGNSSLDVDASSVIYGDSFISDLDYSRISNGVYYKQFDVIVINILHSQSTHYQGMEVIYKNQSGEEQTITVKRGTNRIKLAGIGSPEIRYRSLYSLGEDALEDFTSEYKSFSDIDPDGDIESLAALLDRTKISAMKFIDDSGIHKSSGINVGVAACFDGKIPTSWTENFTPSYHTLVGVEFPVLFSFDMGSEYVLTQLIWYPRHVLRYGHPRIFEIYGATELNPDSQRKLYDADGNLDPYWTKLATFESTRPSGATVHAEKAPLTDEEKQILYGQKFVFPKDVPLTRYIRVRVIETWGGNDGINRYVECNEIELFGAGISSI